MADEQPTPSADVTPTDGGAAPAGSDQQTAETSGERSPNWWQRMFHRGGGAESDAESGDQDPAAQASKALTLTQEELERKVQAETDRREAKRASEARAAKRRELRDTDPWAYAQEEREQEQQQVATGHLENVLAGIGTEHDRVSIDPIVELLPQAERDRILALEGAGRGLEGRKLIVKESMKALERHWKAEGEKAAEARLRRNPAFRKQVLSEVRGQIPEPELLPAYSSSESDRTVSQILRRQIGLG